MIWFSIGILIIGVVLLSIKKPVPTTALRPRSDSVTIEEGVGSRTRENGSDSRSRDEGLESYPPISGASTEPTSAGQGSLARRFAFFGGGAERDGSTRKELRGRKGNERLGDTESIFTPISSTENAEELGADELDPFGDEAEDSSSRELGFEGSSKAREREVVFDEGIERRRSGDFGSMVEEREGRRREEEDEFGDFEGVDDYSAVQVDDNKM